MTVLDLMAGYTAYTDAGELAAMRGTHRDTLVTTTDPTATSLLCPDSAEPGKSVDVSILPILRHGRDNW